MADQGLRKPRRKSKARLHLLESPFPVPIQSITGKSTSNKRKKGTSQDVDVTNQGFFGKGILSKSRPQFTQYNDVLSDHARKQYVYKYALLEPEQREMRLKNFEKLQHERLRQHKEWAKMADENSSPTIEETTTVIENTQCEDYDFDFDWLNEREELTTDGEDNEEEENDIVEESEEVMDQKETEEEKDDRFGMEKNEQDETVGSKRKGSQSQQNVIEEKMVCLEDSYKLFEYLQLTFEEAFFLSYGLGCLSVQDDKEHNLTLSEMWNDFSQRKKTFVELYVAYHHFRSKGWVARFGNLYGADFLLYQDGMPFYHARNKAVFCRSTIELNMCKTYVTFYRERVPTKDVNVKIQEVLLCYVVRPQGMTSGDMMSVSCIKKFKVMAKFCASLLWFVCRVSEDGESDVPPEITSPIEITATNAAIVRPAVSEYLCSGHMYLKVGSKIFKQNITTLWDLIQNMSNKGVYVMDENEEAVTDLDLMEKFPFKLFSHLALMDCMMLLYSNSNVTVESVVNTVRKFSNFNASKELPFDLEDALLLWINKINQSNMVDHDAMMTTTIEHVRMRKGQLVEKKIFPSVHELVDVVKDTKALLSIMLYYLSNHVQFEDMCLSSVLSTEDRIHNIELFRSLCAEHVCTSVFALRVEDFLYASEHLKSNFLTLLCEIFYELEVNPNKRRYIPRYADTSSHASSQQQQQQTGKADSHNSKQHQRQPLLSKRSKKQLAKFETELSEDMNQAAPPPTNSSSQQQAWNQSNEDVMNKKQQKISLDFRPVSGSSIRSSHHNLAHTSAGTPPPQPRSSWTANASYPRLPTDVIMEQQQQQIHTSSHANERESGEPFDSYEEQLKNISMSSRFTNPTFSIEKDYQQKPLLSSCEATNKGDKFSYERNNLEYSDGVKLVENAGTVLHQNSALTASNHVPPQAAINQPYSTQAPKNNRPAERSHMNPYVFTHVGLDQHDEVTDNERYDDDEDEDDDVLSTITEGTEPEAPSLYSFHSSSSASTKYNSSEERLHLIKDIDMRMDMKSSAATTTANGTGGGGFYIDDFHTDMYEDTSKVTSLTMHSSMENNMMANNNTIDGFDRSPQLSVSTSNKQQTIRGSYTVGHGTMEKAMATGIPVITNSMKRPMEEPQAMTQPLHHHTDVNSLHDIATKQPESNSSYLQKANPHSVALTPDHISVSPSSVENGNEFDDAPFDLPHRGTQSASSNSRSSSSGISVDDGRLTSATSDHARPGVMVYSSLSETTDASPIGDAFVASLTEINKTSNDDNDGEDDVTMEANDHMADIENDNIRGHTTSSSQPLQTNILPQSTLKKKKSTLEEKSIFDINKALMEIGNDNNMNVEAHNVEMNEDKTVLQADDQDGARKSIDSLDKLSSTENSPRQQQQQQHQKQTHDQQEQQHLEQQEKQQQKYFDNKENNTISLPFLKDTLNTIQLFQRGAMKPPSPSTNRLPFKEKTDNNKQLMGGINGLTKNVSISPSGKVTWRDLNHAKKKLNPQEAELKFNQKRDLYIMKSSSTRTTWNDIAKKKRVPSDVADILDSALDTGISIVDTLSQLSEIADEGKVNRKKCYEKLQIEDFDEDSSEKVQPRITTHEHTNHSNKLMQSLHETANDNFNLHEDTNKNNSINQQTNKPPLFKRSTYVLEDSPVKSSKDAALQGIPIIEALGDLCIVADSFLKDYTEDEQASTVSAHSDTTSTSSRHSILEHEINTKVNEILESFQQLDNTVDMIKQNALQKHDDVNNNTDDVLFTSATFPTTATTEQSVCKTSVYATDHQSLTFSDINKQNPSSFTTHQSDISSTNDNIIRRQKTHRSPRPQTFVAPDKVTSNEEVLTNKQECSEMTRETSHLIYEVNQMTGFPNLNTLVNDYDKNLTSMNAFPVVNTTIDDEQHEYMQSPFTLVTDKPSHEVTENAENDDSEINIVRRSTKNYVKNSNNRSTFVLPTSQVELEQVNNFSREQHPVVDDKQSPTQTAQFSNVEVDPHTLNENEFYDSDSTVDGEDDDDDSSALETNIVYRRPKSYVMSSKNRGTFVLSKHTNVSQDVCEQKSLSDEELVVTSVSRQSKAGNESSMTNGTPFFITPSTPTSPLKNFENGLMERSSSDTDLSTSFLSTNSQKNSLMSQSLYDFKQSPICKSSYNSLSSGLQDRAQSQPVLNELNVDRETRRKTSVGNVMSKLGMLHKVMSTSLSKLTELHSLKREISLSNSSVDTINNDVEDTQQLMPVTRFSLSGSIDNHIGMKYTRDDDIELSEKQSFQRSFSAPNDGEQLYHDMMRQQSNSSGGTYTLISPPFDVFQKDSSLVLIDMNDTDDEESSEKVFLHSFRSQSDYDENVPRSYHFESDLLMPAEIADEINDDLTNVEDIIKSLEYKWSDKVAPPEHNLTSGRNSDKMVENVLIDSQEELRDDGTSSRNSSRETSNTLYKHVTLSDLSDSIGDINSDVSLDANFDEFFKPDPVRLRKRKLTENLRRVGTYILETSDDIEESTGHSSESDHCDHSDPNSSSRFSSPEISPTNNQNKKTDASFLRPRAAQRETTGKPSARIGTYRLDNYTDMETTKPQHEVEETSNSHGSVPYSQKEDTGSKGTKSPLRETSGRIHKSYVGTYVLEGSSENNDAKQGVNADENWSHAQTQSCSDNCRIVSESLTNLQYESIEERTVLRDKPTRSTKKEVQTYVLESSMSDTSIPDRNKDPSSYGEISKDIVIDEANSLRANNQECLDSPNNQECLDTPNNQEFLDTPTFLRQTRGRTKKTYTGTYVLENNDNTPDIEQNLTAEHSQKKHSTEKECVLSSPNDEMFEIDKNKRRKKSSSSHQRNTMISSPVNQHAVLQPIATSSPNKMHPSDVTMTVSSHGKSKKNTISRATPIQHKTSSLPNSPAHTRTSRNKKSPSLHKKSSSFSEADRGGHKTTRRRSTLDRNETFIKKEPRVQKTQDIEKPTPRKSSVLEQKPVVRKTSGTRTTPLHERQGKETSPKHRNFLRRTSTSYTQQLSPKKGSTKFKKDDQEVREPLTERLASLRLDIEQRRLKFQEEKKKQQEIWYQERAKMIQDVLSEMIHEKENDDPDHKPEPSETSNTTPSKHGASWEVHFEPANKNKEETEAKVEEKKTVYESPRDFIQRKREEKKKMAETPESQKLWFVGFNDEQANDKQVEQAKCEKEIFNTSERKNENLFNTQNKEVEMPSSRNVFETPKQTENPNNIVTSIPMTTSSTNNIPLQCPTDQLYKQTDAEDSNSTVSGTPHVNRKISPPHVSPPIVQSSEISESVPNLKNTPQEENFTLNENISKSLSKLKALNSNTSEIIAKSAEMSEKNETRIQNNRSSEMHSNQFHIESHEFKPPLPNQSHNSELLISNQMVAVPQETSKSFDTLNNGSKDSTQVMLEQSSFPNKFESTLEDITVFKDETVLQHPIPSVDNTLHHSIVENNTLQHPVDNNTTTMQHYIDYTQPEITQDTVFADQSNVKQNQVAQTYIIPNSNNTVTSQPINNDDINHVTTSSSASLSSVSGMTLAQRFEQFSMSEVTTPSYATSTPMKPVPITQTHDDPQVEVQQDTQPIVATTTVELAEDKDVALESDTSTTPQKPKTWGFSFGEEISGENPGLTPDQERKKARFLRNRQKKIEESKRKKEEENEKKRKKEEQAELEKSRLEDEKRKRDERLLAEKLAQATQQLQNEDFSKRLHGITYNMELQPSQEQPQRRKEPRNNNNTQPSNQRHNIRAISPTVKQHQQPTQQQQQRTMSPTTLQQQHDDVNTINAYAEYKGPAAYQKPSGKSNRKIIQNAITHCCLCGEVNKDAKQKCLEAVSQSEASHFLVLFREGLKFRSVYEYQPETDLITRIHGVGPKTITTKMLSSYYKYNSGGKQFNTLDTKHISIQVDGVMIKKELWEKKTNSRPTTTANNLRKQKPPTSAGRQLHTR